MLTFLTAALIARAEDQPAKPSARLIAQLETASSEAEQTKLIAAAAGQISGLELRKQLLARAYQLTLAGDYLRATADCDLTLRLAKEAGDEEHAAAAQVELSFVLRESGNLPAALAAIDEAVAFYEAHPKFQTGLISAYETRGLIYLWQSDFARALQSLNQALTLSRQTNYRAGIIPAYNDIGEVYRTQGEPAKALEFYLRAREVVGDDNAWNMAFIFDNIGMSYNAMGDLEHAIESIQRARAVAEKAGMKPRVATAFSVLGELEAKRGHLEAARKFDEQSLALARQIQDVGVEAKALLGMAQIDLAEGDGAAALEAARQSADLSRQVAELAQVVPALSLGGRALVTLGRDEEARAAFAEAIADVETMRDLVAGGDVERETFFALEIEPYREMIRLLVRQNKPEEALAMAERASARVLLDITSTERADETAVLSPAEQLTERELGLKLGAAQRELVRQRGAGKADPGAIAQDEKKVAAKEEARDDFETVLKAAHPELRRTAALPPLQSLAALAPLLHGGKTALLRYVVTDEETYLFVVRAGDLTAPQLRAFSLGKTRAALTNLTSDFHNRLAARSLAWEKPARELYDLLVQPAGLDLRQLDSVVIVPDGPLWDVPFQTLESEADHPLLADCAVRYAPSLTLLERLPQNPAARFDRPELLALINPSLGEAGEKSIPVSLAGPQWQPLPEAKKQADALRKIYPPPHGDILVGARARESEFKKVAGQAGLLHFATHGVLNDRAPLFSYLLLSQENLAPEEDGRLETREIMQMKLHARLAILCGCETARGEVTAGEGVIGLSWGFFVAGCPATIVSQWKVDSASSTDLMIKLHEQLHTGIDNAEALRRASLDLRNDARYRHPFYWAPFVLLGANR